MKQNLTKRNKEIYFYIDGKKKIIDRNDKSTYPSKLTGNISDLTGNIGGLYGNCTDIQGDLDNCDITEEERKEGIDIRDLINKE